MRFKDGGRSIVDFTQLVIDRQLPAASRKRRGEDVNKAEQSCGKSVRIIVPRVFPPCVPGPAQPRALRPLDRYLRNPRDRTADCLCLLQLLDECSK